MQKCFIIISVISIITQLILFSTISSQLTRFAFSLSSSDTRNPSTLSTNNKAIFGQYIRKKYSQLIIDDFD